MWCQTEPPGMGACWEGKHLDSVAPSNRTIWCVQMLRLSLRWLRPDSSGGVSLVEGRGRAGFWRGSFIPLCISCCFGNTAGRFMLPVHHPLRSRLSPSSPPPFPFPFAIPTHLLLLLGSVYFHFSPYCFPPDPNARIGASTWTCLHLNGTHEEGGWRRAGGGGDAGRIQRQMEARKEKCGDGKQDRREERQECQRGRTISADKWLLIDTTQASFIPLKGISRVNIIHGWQERHRRG